MPDGRPHEEEERGQQRNNQQINNGNGAAPASCPLGNPRDGGVHEICEENGEEKGDQGMARHVKKTEPHDKKKRGEQNSGRACVNEGHFVSPLSSGSPVPCFASRE